MSRRAQLARRTIGATLTEQAHDLQQAQDLSAVQLVERHAHPTDIDGHPWLDTRPARDLRNVTPTEADETEQALQHLQQRGLLVVHAQQQHLVRVVRRPL